MVVARPQLSGGRFWRVKLVTALGAMNTQDPNTSAEATIAHRRSITNHLGTVHAIALCNLAEFTGGLMTDASIPASMRWIPKGMSVEYLKKAVGTQHGVATPEFPPREATEGYELPVNVVVTDPQGDAVFKARISMWVSPKRTRR